MGMSSYYSYGDVKIVDFDGLKKYLADLKAGKFNDRKPTAPEMECGEAVEISKDGKELLFEGMDNWKIISYWYEPFVCFLRDIAVFVEGQVKWSFENDDEGGYITFEDGQLMIHCGQMQWQSFTPEQMCNYRKGLGPLPTELQKRLAARKL